MTSLHFDPNSIFNGIVGGLVLIGLAWAFGRGKAWIWLLGNTLGLSLMRTELKKALELGQDPSRMQVFLLRHVLICFAIVGVGIAYAPVMLLDGGMQWIGPGAALLGLGMYCNVIYALGFMNRVGQGDAYLIRQQEKIDALEARLAAHKTAEEESAQK